MKKSGLIVAALFLVASAHACLVLGQSRTAVFTVDANLQTIAVQATDKHGNYISDLSASDFTLLEDGRPQKIAFFEAREQPISLAILLDVGRSMDFGRKLDRALDLMAPLMRGNLPEDEIFFVPFSDEVGPFRQLTADERLRRPVIPRLGHRGSALYDALASTLCHMRTAKNVRQAVVVISDGMDQHSRLRLNQLIELVRSSNPQVFMVGFYDRPEYEVYRQGQKTVTIVGLREVDNPVFVFERLAKESGAQSFFPSSERDFGKAVDRIAALLSAQYSLAYYPETVDKIRKISIKVDRPGVKISARASVGSENQTDEVHFSATGCDVSPKDHPYPWESRLISAPGAPLVYHEDFSDPRSGWPNRSYENMHTSAQYVDGKYELVRQCARCTFAPASIPGIIAAAGGTAITAYGPWWNNFRATALLEAYWDTPDTGVGMVFDLREDGYYAFLSGTQNTFELVKGAWDGTRKEIVPLTPLGFIRRRVCKLTVERNGSQITLWVDDKQVGNVEDSTFNYGLIGFDVLGSGRAIVHDLLVDADGR